MSDIITVASFTLRRYVRKPLAIVLFIFAPLLLFAFISGSTMNSFVSDVKSVPGGTSLVNSFIAPEGGLETADRECIVFMLMTLFYFAVLSCQSVTGDFKNGINTRFKACPAGALKNIIGKSAGSFVLLFGFSILNLILGKLIFGVNFGSNMIITIATLFLYCIITNSFGILLSAFIRNIYVCCVLDFFINFPMMFVVMYKIFSPIKITPMFSFLSAISIHNYAFNAIVTTEWSALLPLLAIAAVITPLSLLVGRRVLR
jgi:hypothetical protein